MDAIVVDVKIGGSSFCKESSLGRARLMASSCVKFSAFGFGFRIFRPYRPQWFNQAEAQELPSIRSNATALVNSRHDLVRICGASAKGARSS